MAATEDHREIVRMLAIQCGEDALGMPPDVVQAAIKVILFCGKRAAELEAANAKRRVATLSPEMALAAAQSEWVA